MACARRHFSVRRKFSALGGWQTRLKQIPTTITGQKRSEGNMHALQPIALSSRETSPEIVRTAIAQKVWGIASAIDIYHCDPERIRSAEVIRNFCVELCELIEMKRFGDTQVVHFGEDERVAGYSMVQLIETSLISAHFANLTNTTYLDVFSCKPYDPEVVNSFSQTYFGGTYSVLNVTLRR